MFSESNIEGEENSQIEKNPETYNEEQPLPLVEVDMKLITSAYHDHENNNNSNNNEYPNLNSSLFEQSLPEQSLPEQPVPVNITNEIQTKLPFEGKYKCVKQVNIYGVKEMECHFFSEIKVTGEDAIVSKCNLSVQYYFAFQLFECVKDDKSNLIGSVSQGQIFSDKWIFVLCFHEPGCNNCGAVFISKSWYDINREQLLKTGFLFQNFI